LRRAWYMVQPETIINCYKSVGLDTDKRNEWQDKTDDSSNFASSDFDKSDWDALTHCMSIPDAVDFNDYVPTDDNAAVSEVPSDRDVVANAQLWQERTLWELSRSLPSITMHSSDDNLDSNVFCIEKHLQRRLSSAKKQTNTTDFFKLKQST
jgi:hypothetical protein